jgi:hypothetical protein
MCFVVADGVAPPVAICVPMLESTARQASRSAQANVAFSIVQVRPLASPSEP